VDTKSIIWDIEWFVSWTICSCCKCNVTLKYRYIVLGFQGYHLPVPISQ